MDPLFALPPEDITAVEDEQLNEQLSALRQRVSDVVAGRRDPEVVGERTQSQVTDEVEQAVLAIERIEAELAGRTNQDEVYDATLDSLAAKAGVTEDPPAEETAETDPEPVEEPPAVVASGPRGSLPAARRHRPTMQEESSDGLRVTQYAAGLGSPYSTGDVLDRNGLGNFLTEIIRRKRIPGGKAVLAHASYDFPPERRLSDGPDGFQLNSEKVRDVVGPQALTASGPLCAPLPAIYDLPGVETPARPVRDALASFQAARGGVQVGVTPTMGTYADAVGVVTAADNEAGGTSALKSCMRIECPEFSPVLADAIYQCLEADNLSSRAYPELMARVGDLVMAEQARLADSKLLTEIKAASTNVTYGNTNGGASYQLLGALLQAGAGVRSRNRMPEGSRLRALIPFWVIDQIILDQARAASGDTRPVTRDAVRNWISGLGFDAAYYLDGPDDGTGQIFGAQSAGAILSFPDDAQIALYPPGSFIHLDAGELQIGVVRDSSLNATNDHQIFAESWENVAFTGVESLWATVTMCASGTFAAGVDLSAECA